MPGRYSPSGSLQGYPGQLSGIAGAGGLSAGYSTTTAAAQGNPCICGSPATKLFANPRGVSIDLRTSPPQMLVLCDACDFRWTVMRTAGRSEEFITDYEEKQRVRAADELETMRKWQEMQQKYYQVEQLAQQKEMAQSQQNTQGYYSKGLKEILQAQANSIPGQICTENVQTPEYKKSMWEAVKEYVRRKNDGQR